MQMGLSLGLRMEIHDDECIRCGDPKPSDRPCMSCGLEDADVCVAGEASVARVIDEADKARNERRVENGK
jgi:hypothetical protein